MIRKLCPNLNRDNGGLETVLEVPVPEEMFAKMGRTAALRWRSLRNVIKAQSAFEIKNKLDKINNGEDNFLDEEDSDPGGGDQHHLQAKTEDEFMALLKLVGAPLIPFHLRSHLFLSTPVFSHESSMEASKAKYIVQQFIAASGGQGPLNAMQSMYAVGQVRMTGSEMHRVEDSVRVGAGTSYEVGGFVLWQKNPNLWYLELLVAGFKVNAGSDGKVAWHQSTSQPGHASKGPPRPLRRFFQGLDPRCTARLFMDAVSVGEKMVRNEECFTLKVETSARALEAQSSQHTEIIHHTIWGYFNQRTGLLIKLEDTKLVRMKSLRSGAAAVDDSIFWETRMESVMEDYRCVDGITIAHGGETVTRLHRYGKNQNYKRKVEERWSIEEVDFNICGLSMDSFLPPADLHRDSSSTGK